MSRNPKMNLYLAPGLSQQIEQNNKLLTLRLLYYKLHPNAWKQIGCALGKSTSI